MKIIRRLLSILAACLFLVFALVAVGTALHVMSVPTLATLLLSISLFATALVIVRTSVWLWRSAAFWHVGYKRAEVCTVPALVLGLLAAMYYTPATDDPDAVTKFMIAAQIFALFVYLAVRFTTGISKDPQNSEPNKPAPAQRP